MQCGDGGGDFKSICTMVSQRQHPYLTAPLTSSARLHSDNYTVMKSVCMIENNSNFINAPG